MELDLRFLDSEILMLEYYLHNVSQVLSSDSICPLLFFVYLIFVLFNLISMRPRLHQTM